ncbi:MAG: hypothetical protein ACO3NK_00135 [Prochlorotrichaceae cyanobacterium]|jgi:hypothetical protein
MSANAIKCFRSPQSFFADTVQRGAGPEWGTEHPHPAETNRDGQGSQEALPLVLGALAGLTLGGIFCARQIYSGLVHLGQGSEEIFRGHQLPILKFPRREG